MAKVMSKASKESIEMAVRSIREMMSSFTDLIAALDDAACTLEQTKDPIDGDSVIYEINQTLSNLPTTNYMRHLIRAAQR